MHLYEMCTLLKENVLDKGSIQRSKVIGNVVKNFLECDKNEDFKYMCQQATIIFEHRKFWTGKFLVQDCLDKNFIRIFSLICNQRKLVGIWNGMEKLVEDEKGNKIIKYSGTSKSKNPRTGLTTKYYDTSALSSYLTPITSDGRNIVINRTSKKTTTSSVDYTDVD